MVEGTGLENQQACKRLVGSNPTLSASLVVRAGSFATTRCEFRQARKGATVTAMVVRRSSAGAGLLPLAAPGCVLLE